MTSKRLLAGQSLSKKHTRAVPAPLLGFKMIARAMLGGSSDTETYVIYRMFKKSRNPWRNAI
jgi:hypothetical protein